MKMAKAFKAYTLETRPKVAKMAQVQDMLIHNIRVHLANQHQYSHRDFCDKLAEILGTPPAMPLPDCAGSSPCTTCANKRFCATGCVRMEEFVSQSAEGNAGKPDAALVHQAAQNLINLANQAGQVVTIERSPCKPLAMGHAEYRISTRELRKGGAA